MNDKRFTFLCTNEERDQLRILANHHHRSQSDVIRMLIRNAFLDMVTFSMGSVTNDQSTLTKEVTHEPAPSNNA